MPKHSAKKAHRKERKKNKKSHMLKDYAKKYGTVASWVTIAMTLIFSLVTFFAISLPADHRAQVAATFAIAAETRAVAAVTSASAAETRAVAAATSASAAETRAVAADNRSIALFEPRITFLLHVATSHDLSAQADLEWRSRQDLNTISIVNTTYYKQQDVKELDNPNLRYLFIILANRSTGDASHITIEELEWFPKFGQFMPTGVDDIPQLDGLGSGQAIAILVDIAEGLMDDSPLENSHARNICMKFTYTNLIDTASETQSKCIKGINLVLPTEP